jgi:ParB family chromosome partitioning protein
MIIEIPIDAIDDPVDAMRVTMDNDQLVELAQSIRSVGLIEPIIVKQNGDRYEVVAGHRRLKAASMAGLITIKSIVRSGSDEEMEVIKVHENFCRSDVDLVDEAFFIARAMQRLNKSPYEFADLINRSAAYVKDRILITTFEDYLLEYLNTKRVSLAVAKILTQITDDNYRRMCIDYAAKNGITAQVARMWLNDSLQGTFAFTQTEDPTPHLPLEAPAKIWTVECSICSGQIPVNEAKLAYAHSGCLAEIAPK